MNLNESITSIQNTTDQIMQVSEGLPDEVIRRKPSEDKWSIMEVLCHVEEAVPYWLREIQSLVQSPGSEWGRGLQHEGRLAAVAGAGNRSIKEVLERIAASKGQVQEILGSLREEDLNREAPSSNPRFGTKPLSFIIGHLLVEHQQTHLKQIERNIRQFEEGNQTN
jgi:uncharacterized damage-inducible protein DinB